MPAPIKTYVHVLPRHNRMMFFVDASIEEAALRELMQANLHVWGGRYNPIIPVKDSIIEKEWMDLIQHYDPDYIYCSSKIDVGIIAALNLFHPLEYRVLREDGRFDVPGVNIHNLLFDHVHDFLNNMPLTLLRYDGTLNMALPAKNFYKLNIGLLPAYVDEKKWSARFREMSITNENCNEINKIIYEYGAYFKSLLSTRHVNTALLIPDDGTLVNQFELIVYDKDNYLSDLLYFWNRQLYISPDNRLSQLVCSEEEVQQLIDMPYFEALLLLALGHTVTLISRSLPTDSLEDICTKAQARCRDVRIISAPTKPFPYSIKGSHSISSKPIRATTRLILGRSDFLHFPNLSFESGVNINNGPYCLDIIIEKDANDVQKEIMFPYKCMLEGFIHSEKARVNRNHRMTMYTDKEQSGTMIKVPSDMDIIRIALMYRVKQDTVTHLPVDEIELSPAGQKFSAFCNIFDWNWYTIQEFMANLFWVRLFMFDSELEDSPLPKQKGIFSHLDLTKEIEQLFAKYKDLILDRLASKRDLVISSEDGKKIIERETMDAITYFLDPQLDYLIKNGGLFMGMKVSCPQCGSKRWYSLTELKDKMSCKGCNNEIMPNMSSQNYLKLSDVLVNNVLSDLTRNAKNHDGNYVVLKTLLYLKMNARNSGYSFLWCPPLNYTRKGKHKIKSDIDIVVILEGELILGEAKDDAGEFYNKEIKKLIWMGNNLLPDKIIVACNTGNLEPIVDKIKAELTNPKCEVISYKVDEPRYRFGQLIGLP